jgi:hypothetical protein
MMSNGSGSSGATTSSAGGSKQQATTPYQRPSGATTPAQRASVQGKLSLENTKMFGRIAPCSMSESAGGGAAVGVPAAHRDEVRHARIAWRPGKHSRLFNILLALLWEVVVAGCSLLNSGSRRADCRRASRGTPMVAEWTPRQPRREGASDCEPKSYEGIGDVAFRPRRRPRERAVTAGRRGENAAYAQQQ